MWERAAIPSQVVSCWDSPIVPLPGKDEKKELVEAPLLPTPHSPKKTAAADPLPASPSVAAKATRVTGRLGYAVRIGAYRMKKSLDADLAILDLSRDEVTINATQVDGAPLYRVETPPYNTKADAISAATGYAAKLNATILVVDVSGDPVWNSSTALPAPTATPTSVPTMAPTAAGHGRPRPLRPPRPTSTPTPPPTARRRRRRRRNSPMSRGDCLVDVGLFSQDETLDKTLSKLRDEGYRPIIEIREVEGKELRRVRVGPYTSDAEATTVSKEVDRLLGVKSHIYIATR